MNTIASPHRNQLSDFLKSCRARLLPEDVGLPGSIRRRVPGLRREDVAALTGVSVTWYTWLEQGRAARVSERVLEKISGVLKLTDQERDYLFSLVQNRPPPFVQPKTEEVPQNVIRMMNNLNVPAYVMTIQWDVVAWNEMISRTFRDYTRLRPEQRNIVRILLSSPEYLEDPEQHEIIIRRILSKLRYDFSQAGDDPTFNAFIDDLNANYPIFRQLWPSVSIETKSEGIHTYPHPQCGGITFEHSSYIIEGTSSLRLIIFTPVDAESSGKLLELQKKTD